MLDSIQFLVSDAICGQEDQAAGINGAEEQSSFPDSDLNSFQHFTLVAVKGIPSVQVPTANPQLYHMACSSSACVQPQFPCPQRPGYINGAVVLSAQSTPSGNSICCTTWRRCCSTPEGHRPQPAKTTRTLSDLNPRITYCQRHHKTTGNRWSQKEMHQLDLDSVTEYAVITIFHRHIQCAFLNAYTKW